MDKFLVIAKREYKRLIFTKSFLFSTFALPIFPFIITLVPLLLTNFKSETTRLVVVEKTGQIGEALRNKLSTENLARDISEQMGEVPNQAKEATKAVVQRTFGEFKVETIDSSNGNLEDIRRQLDEKILAAQLDAYLIIPEKPTSSDANFEFYMRNATDTKTRIQVKETLSGLVRDMRLREGGIEPSRFAELTKDIEMTTTEITKDGANDDYRGGLLLVLVLTFLTFTVLLINGMQVITAIMEEKETRIAEILFSSTTPFQLLAGKLIGVGMAGLTQFAIWFLSILLFGIYGVTTLKAMGFQITSLSVSPLTFILVLFFFLLGYFVYAALYAIIGSIFPSIQEVGAAMFLPMTILIATLYASMMVLREPSSTLSVTLSILPFFAPMLMPLRIILQTPPFWQIVLSSFISLASTAALVWVAGKIYRVGMLMYGKRATLPEVLRWIRQS